jgi:hypothetical protein
MTSRLRTLGLSSGLIIVLSACGATPVARPSAPAGSPSSAPSPSASAAATEPPPVDGAPVSRSTEDQGVVLTLQLSTDHVRAGDPVQLIVTATNNGAGIVFWQGGGCDLLQDVSLDAPPAEVVQVGDPPAGDGPDAVAGLVRWSALSMTSPTAMPFVPPNLPAGQMFACTSDLRINELKPGETARVAAVWHGVAGDGTPAPAGLYHVKLTFPFLARQAAAPFKGDAFADQHPITLDAGFEVAGGPWSGLTSSQAIDKALADARVKAWIADALPKTQVGGARIRLTEQGSWRFEIDRMTPDGMNSEVATIEIDPTTGAVTSVTLPPA